MNYVWVEAHGLVVLHYNSNHLKNGLSEIRVTGFEHAPFSSLFFRWRSKFKNNSNLSQISQTAQKPQTLCFSRLIWGGQNQGGVQGGWVAAADFPWKQAGQRGGNVF